MSPIKKHPILLLWKMSFGSRTLYLVSFLLMLLSVLCSFLLPQVIRFVVDDVIGGVSIVQDIPEKGGEHFPSRNRLAPFFESIGLSAEKLRENHSLIGILVVGIAAAGGVFSFTFYHALASGAEGLIKRLRDRLYSHIQNLPYEWHIGVQTGDIIQRCTSDVDIVRNFVSTQVVEIVRAVVLAVFAYSVLFSMNAGMAMASFVFLPVMVGYSYFFLRGAMVNFLAADEAEGQLLAVAQENFTGVRVVRAFGRERYEIDRFDRQNRLFAELWMKLGKTLSTYWGLGDTLTGLQTITICAVGALEAARGLTIGEFIVFLSYNSMIVWPVRALGRALSEAGKTGVSLERLQEILDAPPETDSEDISPENPPIDGDVEFDRVNFSYGGVPILRDVSFTVKRGATLGVLGATGSGKTTIAHLLCRLYDLKDGDGVIRIGGVDIRKYKRRWLRENVGIVLQEPFLFSRTIRENIASLSPFHTMERIREAAAIAQVDESIGQFEKGYDTIVGERGVTLSGGQKQRVAIARTLLKETPILIFDDSLSAVDAETDARINAGLRRRTEGITTLIIAHRIASLSKADKILVMENGRVAEFGSPAELLGKNGVYRRVYSMQSAFEYEMNY